MKNKPTVGQIIFSLNVGNAARGCEQVLTAIKVTKVGRKYFTAGEGWRANQFHLSDWRENTDYTASEKLYESELEWSDEKESNRSRKSIAPYFLVGCRSPGNQLSLITLHAIEQLIEEDQPKH
tara:strand:- start:490 stop:858 length:369 start_codon:yes stop_codon:yes gene_type:complete